MEPLNVILNRFVRLLPFLTAPNSYRHFHFDLFYPYPDVWDASRPPAAGPRVRPYLTETEMDLHTPAPARGEPFW